MPETALSDDPETYAQDIVNTVREPLLILDETLRVRFANRAFYEMFQVSSEETERQLIYELGNGQWDSPDLRRLLEDIVPRDTVFQDFELSRRERVPNGSTGSEFTCASTGESVRPLSSRTSTSMTTSTGCKGKQVAQ